MGGVIAKLFSGFGKKEVRILMVGLDAAGIFCVGSVRCSFSLLTSWF